MVQAVGAIPIPGHLVHYAPVGLDPQGVPGPLSCLVKPAADLGVGPISVRREGELARWPGGVSLRLDSDSSWFVSGPID
jgi:hypothetical protein